MRTLVLVLAMTISAVAADKTFENSVLSFRYPDSATLNELDFDYMPEISWKLMIDGKAAIIGMQRDDETSQQQLLDSASATIKRHLDGGSASDLTTFGALQRCKGITVKGPSKNPNYQGEVAVHVVTFTSGKKTVLLVAIVPAGDARFTEVLTTVRGSVKLKNN